MRAVMCGIFDVIELIYLLLRLYMLSSASLRHADKTQKLKKKKKKKENDSPPEPKVAP